MKSLKFMICLLSVTVSMFLLFNLVTENVSVVNIDNCIESSNQPTEALKILECRKVLK